MRIKELREHAGLQQKELASIIGISPNTLSQYENKKREPNYEVLSKLADYFNVSIDYIYGYSDIVTCEKCGLSYSPSVQMDRDVHKEYHKRWEDAQLKFGKIYSLHSECERVKAKNRNIVSDTNKSLEERYAAQLEVFRCLFSRSLEAHNYNPNHVDYATYVSMLLNQQYYKKILDVSLYQKLVSEYGTSEGIAKGTYYESIPDNMCNNIDYLSEYDSIISKYRSLDNHGKEMVDFTLEKEWERSKANKNIEITSSSNAKGFPTTVQEFPAKYSSLNAAHSRTDIEFTEEERAADEAMIDDDDDNGNL